MNRRELLGDAGEARGPARAAGRAARTAPGRPGRAAGRRPNVLILMTDQERHPDRLPGRPADARALLDGRQRHAHRPLPRLVDGLLAVARVLLDRACTRRSRACTARSSSARSSRWTRRSRRSATSSRSSATAPRSSASGTSRFPGEPPTNLEAALDIAQGNPLKGYGFDDSAISPPADVGAYNDGYTNDPIWTGQAGRLAARARRRRPAVAVRAEPAQPARHPVLPARLPRRLQAPRLRRRARAVVLRRADAGRQAAARRRRFRNVVSVIAGTPPGTRERPGVLARPPEHLLRPDRRHRRDARRARSARSPPGSARRHGDRAHLRPRRARLGAPPAEQGHDDLRRAEPRAVHGRLPEALPARARARRRSARRSTSSRRCSSSAARPTRSRAGRGCAA